jgi:hypothetical protein
MALAETPVRLQSPKTARQREIVSGGAKGLTGVMGLSVTGGPLNQPILATVLLGRLLLPLPSWFTVFRREATG